VTTGAGPAPSDEATVISPEWLTEVLDQRYPGAVVVATTVTQRLETVATKVRFRLRYADDKSGGAPAPPALCAKGYFNPAVRSRMGQGRPTEVEFYRDIASTIPVRMPTCIHAGVDEDTRHGLILMEDLIEQGATFLDPRSVYSPEAAAGSLDQLAALHASHWVDPILPAMFPPRLEALAGVFDAAALQAQLDDGRVDGLPDEVRDGDRLKRSMLALANVGRGLPGCLVHGDVHTGNIFLSPDGDPGLIDWQVAQCGGWALDVSYHLATVLDPDVRAESERSLLDHYLDRLAARGTTPPEREEAWWLYRSHLPYGYFLWGITRAVERPVIEHLIGRLASAVAFHGSFGLLDV
jgi:Phosphotransferase enzyme family